MRTLLDQLEQSLSTRLFYLSLMTALTIPDIAGALDSVDGEASGKKYIDWYEAHVRPQMSKTLRKSLPPAIAQKIPEMQNPLTGDACYRFRCSLLHQGTSQHPKSPYSRIIFIQPGATTNVVHYGQSSGALCIDLKLFCQEMIDGTRAWLDTVENTNQYKNNYEKFARIHISGLSPYVGGVPVIG